MTVLGKNGNRIVMSTGSDTNASDMQEDSLMSGEEAPDVLRPNQNIKLSPDDSITIEGNTIKVDEHGIPILETEQSGVLGANKPANKNQVIQKPVQQPIHEEHNIDTSDFTMKDATDPKLIPLKSLIDCADKSTIQINIAISLNSIDRKLYEVLTQNFKSIDGVEDKLSEMLYQTLDQNELRNQIIAAITKRYKESNTPQ